VYSLCRPTSNKFKLDPFRPIRAVPVDLFPHTPLCELVVELRRGAALALHLEKMEEEEKNEKLAKQNAEKLPALVTIASGENLPPANEM
jgi:hypothetical protein